MTQEIGHRTGDSSSKEQEADGLVQNGTHLSLLETMGKDPKGLEESRGARGPNDTVEEF